MRRAKKLLMNGLRGETLKINNYLAIFVALNLFCFAVYDSIFYSWLEFVVHPNCFVLLGFCMPALFVYVLAAYVIIFYLIITAYLFSKVWEERKS